MVDQNEMLNIITPMMEHVCEHLCRFPKEVADQEALDIICGVCEMDQYTNDILNTYNRVNDFQNTQRAKLLKELVEDREKQRWVPVSERLPEAGKMVLLTIQYEPFNTRSVIKSVMMASGIWRRYAGEVVLEKPIAWIPLPKSYQSEQPCEVDWRRHLMERFGRCE